MRAPLTPAEATAAVLVESRANNPAAMIPGAFEVRDAIPAARSAVPITRQPDDIGASDRGRLEREREGGGAPSQRGRRRGTFLSRLWRTVLHPAQRPDIWRRRRVAAA